MFCAGEAFRVAPASKTSSIQRPDGNKGRPHVRWLETRLEGLRASAQVSFGGLGVKVSDEQLQEAADSMLASGIASRGGVSVVQARKSISAAASARLAASSALEPQVRNQCFVK